MKQYITLPNIIIVSLLILIIWMKACGNSPQVSPVITKDTITTVEIKTDTIKGDTVYIPVPYKIYPQPIPHNIDTPSILKNYYAKYVYNDTIVKNDSLNIFVLDTISQNKIISRSVKYNAIVFTKIITNNITEKIPEDPTRKFYIGGTLGFNRQFFNMASINLDYIPKNNKHLFGIGVGLDNNIQPTAQIKLGWKIGK